MQSPLLSLKPGSNRPVRSFDASRSPTWRSNGPSKTDRQSPVRRLGDDRVDRVADPDGRGAARDIRLTAGFGPEMPSRSGARITAV